jgi:pyruvate/2-oxoglutarate dehydrogenase complex dihydrolipoamide acyltransferase (E2) component
VGVERRRTTRRRGTLTKALDNLDPKPLGAGRGARILASPAVRERAKDLGIDLAQVRAPSGRVRHADLDAFLTIIRAPIAGGQPARRRADQGGRPASAHRREYGGVEAPHPALHLCRGIRRHQAGGVARGSERNARHKDRLTIMPLLIVAICKALPAFPMINARYDDEAGVVTRHRRGPSRHRDADRCGADGAGDPRRAGATSGSWRPRSRGSPRRRAAARRRARSCRARR